MINLNLYKMELSRFRGSMLVWAWAVGILIIIDMALFQVFLKEGMIDKIKPFMESPMMGPMMKGFGLDIQKLSDILGFYVIRNTPLILLLVGMFAVLTSNSIFANEEYEKTAEFLYTRPLTRLEIFLSKALACFTHIAIINVIIIIVGFVSLEIFKTQPYSHSTFFFFFFYGFLSAFIFTAIGFLIGLIPKRGRGTTALSVGIVMGTYFLDIISKVSKDSEFIGYISPFRYVDTNVLVDGYSLNPLNVTFFLAVTVVLTSLSLVIFTRKDILN